MMVSEAFFPTYTLTFPLVFFGQVFWYNQNGNHPWEDLTKSGYKSDM
jgi:hypothetical protein